VALAAALTLLVGACGSSGSNSPAPDESDGSAVASAKQFLAHYVDGDGRVVRHDQGGDTVSEGQGYALLLAVAARDSATFTRVWTWTAHHLQQPSHLFASRWAGGRVTSTEPAADADVQIAWALSLAARRFHHPAWTDAAREIAVAVAEHEVGYDEAGRPFLAAGPWAIGSRTAEPGYWTPPATTALAALTKDNRWRDLRTSYAMHLRAVTRNAATLPPDWAAIGANTPVAAPSGGAPVQSGPDGMRALVWARCSSSGQALLPQWWRLIAGTASAAPLARALDGRPSSPDLAPLSAVAAAAAADAAGHAGTGKSLLSRAAGIEAKYPTYYGAAWVALGRVLLTTHLLTTCSGDS
jgi:endoglucanase